MGPLRLAARRKRLPHPPRKRPRIWMESAGAFDFSCAFGDGRLSLVNAGGCVGRSASKCLQAAVLEICVGEERSRMEQLLWPSCQNSHGCGLGGSQVEAMNFWAVEGALRKAHCYLSVVEAQRRSDVRDGRGLTAWKMGDTQGALLGTVAWVHHEHHVFVVRGRQAPALAARLTQGASLDVAPWARGVVGAPKRSGPFARSLARRLSRESSEPMQPEPTESVGCSAGPALGRREIARNLISQLLASWRPWAKGIYGASAQGSVA